MTKQIYSFRGAMDMLPHGKVKEVREELMSALSITTYAGFYKRRDGATEPTISEFNTIENIFRKHGILNCWDQKH